MSPSRSISSYLSATGFLSSFFRLLKRARCIVVPFEDQVISRLKEEVFEHPGKKGQTNHEKRRGFHTSP